MSAAVSLDALRARIRAIEGSAQVQRRRVTSGVEALDALIEGLPRPGIVEISGPPGSGRARLALALVAAATTERAVAWVDPLRQLYPPAAAAAGVALDHLLIVRPPATPVNGAYPEMWTTEQLLRSGNFPLVVCMIPSRREAGSGPRDRVGSPRVGGYPWARAAEQGQCTAVVLAERPQRDVPADIRLGVEEGEIHLLRDRGGAPGARTARVPCPELLVPW